MYLTIEQPPERSSGIVDQSGGGLVSWIGGFLHEEHQADVLKKLMSSGAAERHAFIILPGFNTAPFDVSYALMADAAPRPTASPELPDEVTHVWLASTWTSGQGLRWDRPSGWAAFDKSAADQRSASRK